MKNIHIVLGLGFGDEGKGRTVDQLSGENPEALVVRFSGGHQVGHTVVFDGQRHVFSNFGAGTLRGVPAFWSRHCTLNPEGILQEAEVLRANGIQPKLILSPLAQVTTPFDIAWNRAVESFNRHGSVGVGFGATVARNETPNKLYAQDLKYPFVLEQKLEQIGRFYEEKARNDSRRTLAGIYARELEKVAAVDFVAVAEALLEFVQIRPVGEVFQEYETLIFEGSQGILLDQDHGFFPNVTRSWTTSRNAMELLREQEILAQPQIWYVSRAYQTRHGNGPLAHETEDFPLVNNAEETNRPHEWQGNLRYAPLDIDLVEYALESDLNYSEGARRNLVLTCFDHFEGAIPVVRKGEQFEVFSGEELVGKTGFSERFEEVWLAYGPSAKEVSRLESRVLL